MKKIIISLSFMILLTGCSIATDSGKDSSSQSIDLSDILQKELDFSDKSEVDLEVDEHVEELFSSLNMYSPSGVDLFIGENHDYIGFKYQNGITLPDNSYEELRSTPESKFGVPYLYYGKLTRLSENVYSSQGNYLSAWKYWDLTVSDDIDFYIVENDEKYYICFENLSLEDLEKYRNEYGLEDEKIIDLIDSEALLEKLGLNHSEIMAANFSSIAGEYVNSEGNVIFLDEDGLNDNERQTREVYGSPDSGYFMGIHPKEELDGGYLLMVFPIGVEVLNLEGLTDTTKVRICYGQAEPMSVEEVYTKK